MSRKILPIITAVCAAAGAVCYTLALTRGYDDAVQHFAAGSPLCLCILVLCFVGILAGIAAGCLARGSGEIIPAENTAPVTFAACAVAFMSAAAMIFNFIGFTPGALLLLRLLFQALTAAFFLLLAMTHEKSSNLYAALSLCPIVYAILHVLEIYYQEDLAMNSPLKVIRLMFFLAFALYATSEARVALGRTASGSFTAFAAIAGTLGIVAGGGELAAALIGSYAPLSLIDAAQYLSVGCLAMFRIYSFRKPEALPAGEAEDGGDEENRVENDERSEEA